MTDYKLVPLEPTPEMVSAAEDAYMPFGDMELALRMAILAAPDVQGELVGWQFYKHGKWWNGDILTKKQRKNIEEEGVRVRNVYAEPQFVEWTPAPDVSGLVEALEALEDLVSEIESNTCPHDNTYRGGAIWEVCEDCGEKWADDMGGKPEFAWPESVETARNLIHAHRKQGDRP